MLIAHRKISPLLLALPVLAAIAAAVALRGGDTSAPRSHHVAPAIPFADAAPRTLSTPQLVARYRAEAAAKPRSAQAVDNLALAELQMAREDGDPTWYTRADALFGHALDALAARLHGPCRARLARALAPRLRRRARARPARACDRPVEPLRDGRRGRRRRRAGPLRRRAERHRAPAAPAPRPRVVLARLVLPRAARPHRRRPEGARAGHPGRRAVGREHRLGVPLSREPRVQPRPLRRGRGQLPDRAPHLSGLRARPGRPGEAGGRPRAVRAVRSPATPPSSSATRSRRT